MAMSCLGRHGVACCSPSPAGGRDCSGCVALCEAGVLDEAIGVLHMKRSAGGDGVVEERIACQWVACGLIAKLVAGASDSDAVLAPGWSWEQCEEAVRWIEETIEDHEDSDRGVAAGRSAFAKLHALWHDSS